MAKVAWQFVICGITRCFDMDVNVGDQEVPMRLEMKRLAPGETNTWFIDVLGTDRGVPHTARKGQKTLLCTFERKKEQVWQRIDLGHRDGVPHVHRRDF